MEASALVEAAARAVLDVLEREWQPLSAGELERRLDQAVEEVLEAELIGRLRTQLPPPPPPVYVQFLQSQQDVPQQLLHSAVTGSPVEEEEEERGGGDPGQEQLDSVDSAAVKHIADLLQTSKSQRRLAGRARLSLSHTVLLSLTLLSERVSYRSVSRRFLLEKGNIHRIFFSFCERINALEERLMAWPVGEDAARALFPLFNLEDAERDVPRVLGVLGHTQIPIRLPLGKHDVETTTPEVKRMKKEAHPDSWLHLELLCDRRGRMFHCRISKGSEVDRGRTLRDQLKQHPELMPPGSCLVAKPGYPLTDRILTPYETVHGAREELYNKILEEHFQILDQAVANLRTRFQRLRYLDIGNYERARAVVLTACVLHNVFLDLGQAVHGDVEKEEDVNREGETDEDGARRRDAIADLLIKSF